MQTQSTEYRRSVARALRQAGIDFDLIAEVLRGQTKIEAYSSDDTHRAASFGEEEPHAVAAMRRSGVKFIEAGTMHGVANAQPRMVAQMAVPKTVVPVWLRNLDRRTANALLLAGFRSVDDVRKAVERRDSIFRPARYRVEVVEKWLDRQAA